MAERSFFFNSLNGDRKYQADDFVSYFKELVTNGVFKDDDSLNLKVQAYSGMKVRVNKGAAIINGYRYLNDASLDLTVEASDPINPRIDLVVLRLDVVNRIINIVIKKGVPGSVPVKPSLITDSVVEMPLASIKVNKGVVSITSSNIADERVFAYSYLDVNHKHTPNEINNLNDFISKLIDDECEITEYTDGSQYQKVKKYADGRMEIYQDFAMLTGVNVSWGNCYVHNDAGTTPTNFAVPFISVPRVKVSAGYNNTGASFWAVAKGAPTVNRGPIVQVCRATTYSTSTEWHIIIEAEGRWK